VSFRLDLVGVKIGGIEAITLKTKDGIELVAPGSLGTLGEGGVVLDGEEFNGNCAFTFIEKLHDRDIIHWYWVGVILPLNFLDSCFLLSKKTSGNNQPPGAFSSGRPRKTNYCITYRSSSSKRAVLNKTKPSHQI
jgi:hypothetical protein